MQLRHDTNATLSEYTEGQLWARAKRPRCPFHPSDDCGLRLHGTYTRSPDNTPITRFYCRKASRTISLLPDCLPSHLAGTTAEIENSVHAFNEAVSNGSSVAQAAQDQRPSIGLQGAMRWMRRRRRWIRIGLTLLATLAPEKFIGHQVDIETARRVLATPCAVVVVRKISGPSLLRTAWPIGLRPRGDAGFSSLPGLQHEMGNDPPTPSG